MRQFIFVLTLVALSACSQYKKGEGDLLYSIHEDKTGLQIKTDDFVGLTAIETTEEDSVTYNSNDYERPSYMYCGTEMFKGDLTSGLRLLSEGDSATLKINIDSMVKIGRPKPVFTKGKYFIYHIKITKVLSKGSMNDSLFNIRVNDFIQKEEQQWKNAELSKIKDYILFNKMNPIVTASGLNYQILKIGKGLKPVQGDSVDVHFTTKLLNGKVIDSSLPGFNSEFAETDHRISGQPVRWSEGTGSRFFMPGFNEGIMLFPKGTKARLILPSKLAYGAEGKQGVPPYIPLVVDLEIMNIIPRK